MKIRRLIYLVAVAGVLTLSGCHSHRHTVRGDHGRETVHRNHEKPDNNRKDKPKGVAGKIIAEGRRWIGTPYKYGGQSRKGMDCSGFVQLVYDNAADIKLPRSSRDMAGACKRISRKELRPADLVFFVSSRGGKRINHVAIYVGDGRILHSTTSRGVIESNLNEGYWDEHYYSSGRVI